MKIYAPSSRQWESTGDATDGSAPNEFIKKINDLFSKTEISVTICYGKIQIPKDKGQLGRNFMEA